MENRYFLCIALKLVYTKERMVFGYEVTLRTTGTPAAEKNLENQREKHLWKTLWLSFFKLYCGL
jgi:hypothetical protein